MLPTIGEKPSGFKTDKKAIDKAYNQKPIPPKLIDINIMTMFAKKLKKRQFLSLEAEEIKVLITARVAIITLGCFQWSESILQLTKFVLNKNRFISSPVLSQESNAISLEIKNQ